MLTGQSSKGTDTSIPARFREMLLVDDEEDVLKMLQEMSEHLGYQVTAVSDSTEAYTLSVSSPEDFDLVVTDQTMPGRPALAQKISVLKRRVPIIVCTGFSETLTDGKARELGLAGYIMKPVVMADFARVAAGCLGRCGMNIAPAEQMLFATD